MRRFTNILVHINLSITDHPALARGVQLAMHNNAKLTAIAVIEEYPAQAHAVLRSLHLKDQLESIEREFHEQLETIVQPIRDSGLDVKTTVASGSAFVELIRVVLRNRHDLLIKTVGSEGIFHRTFFGSTDMHLLRKCPAPLWLIKAGERTSFRRILIPLDPNMEHGVKLAVGMNLLKLGISLAKMDGAELLIVHAWHAYAEDQMKKHMESKEFEDYVGSWRRTSSQRTSQFTTVFEPEIKPSCVHLVHGEAGFVIPKFATDHEVDLVVMGTLGQLGQHGMFIGDTAERILNRLECSVLAVKPDGFVSPVT